MSSEESPLDADHIFYLETGQLPPSYLTSVFDEETTSIPIPVPIPVSLPLPPPIPAPLPTSIPPSAPSTSNETNYNRYVLNIPRRVVPVQRSSTTCRHCGNEYASRRTLENHMLKLGDHRHVTCDYCDKVFASVWQYNHHMEREGRCEKPYQCTLCMKKFSTFFDATIHQTNCGGNIV